MVNNPDYIDTSYQRFLVNRFRELLPFDEVPIKLHVRGRGEEWAHAAEQTVRHARLAGQRPTRALLR